ncbi:protein JASON-like isoform X2 [Cucurbita pepo subsp. pepo]|uniref:protein JASON-like isoform X2 n=1 Tax=Cucurbita pepo subsp. pepo TaxID=3664 RepID=UPI000C9D9D06|nr:protein JASON-like isoform X2 [Cucurbita pepo subsp. pepo]
MCAQLRCKLGFLCRSLVGFLDRSVSRAMGCFFDCFKVRDDRHRPRAHLVSDPSCSKYRAPVVARNKLSSLFLSEENEDFPRNDSGSKSFGSPRYTKELKDEAKFLKACGTIVETPAEIRKASRKLLGSPHDDRDLEPPKYPSLPNASLETPPDPPRTPAKHLEEGRSEPGSAERTPSSCTTSEQNTQRVSALNSPDHVMTTCQNKVNRSPSRSSSESGREELDSSGMNPVESESNLEGLSREVKESVQELEMMTPIPERTVRANTREKELVVEASLSAWLKPVATHDDDGLKFGGAHRPIRVGRSAGDRPIIGMVAAHWSEDEPVQISPKEWDGNGIPNSTNKYKEDQKVSWHATPFEERLEKALSEESIVTRKNFQGKLVAFDEEDDTAVSRVQPAIQPSSVVSY